MAEPVAHREQKRFPWAGTLVLLFVFYVLSVGPLSGMYSLGIIPDRVAEQMDPLYSPLEWAARESDAVRRLIEWYCSLFR